MNGEGGTIELFFGQNAVAAGTLGRWRIRRGEDGWGVFTGLDCIIASFWLSAGVTRARARPHAHGKPKPYYVEGDVSELTIDKLILRNITIIDTGGGQS